MVFNHFRIARVAAAALCLSFSLPAWAVEPEDLAPPGACAGEERELRVSPDNSGDGSTSSETSLGGAAETTAGPPRIHLSPVQVASGGTPGGAPLPLPTTPTFGGPGPCDSPGSGCQGPVLPATPGMTFSEQAPNTGGGFPGGGQTGYRP